MRRGRAAREDQCATRAVRTACSLDVSCSQTSGKGGDLSPKMPGKGQLCSMSRGFPVVWLPSK